MSSDDPAQNRGGSRNFADTTVLGMTNACVLIILVRNRWNLQLIILVQLIILQLAYFSCDKCLCLDYFSQESLISVAYNSCAAYNSAAYNSAAYNLQLISVMTNGCLYYFSQERVKSAAYNYCAAIFHQRSNLCNYNCIFL